ncbi:hypothetical protein [Marinobacter caseinilyticus]|uniref:hypothetical protein n=1 Tax=Marinobacter caseinilyticus TaxID=2692195 RepID=UPI00140DDFA1|nr:hypothetical protein [Marinobacter caseinilyticus]
MSNGGRSLTRYIACIREGLPINYYGFVQALPESVRFRHESLFRTEKVASNRWRVTCLNESILDALEAAAAAPESRTEAAAKGDSHQYRTARSFLLVYHAELSDERPAVVMLSVDHSVQDFVSKPNALVVENEENFARPEAMLAFASLCSGRLLSLSNTDVILGGGSRIARSLNVAWLKCYEQLWCAFDYDLGGLRLYQALQKKLGTRVVFVQPADWHDFYSRFTMSPKSTDRCVQAITLASAMGFDALARAFRETGHFMEQECVLDNIEALQSSGGSE